MEALWQNASKRPEPRARPPSNEPRALNELHPNWAEEGAPVNVPVGDEKFYFLTEEKSISATPVTSSSDLCFEMWICGSSHFIILERDPS